VIAAALLLAGLQLGATTALLVHLALRTSHPRLARIVHNLTHRKARRMSVYVDNARIPARVGTITAKWSHLITDNPNVEELHRFAATIGLRRSWFQTGKVAYRPHYDVTESKRDAAIAAGATEIDVREVRDVLARARSAGQGDA
jgi:nicotinamide mononucleotide adenylyltransferase